MREINGLKPYMGYDGLAGSIEGACLIFAHSVREARRHAWKCIQDWFDADFINVRARLIKDGQHLFTEADQEKLAAGIPHIIEAPKSCNRCGMWGEVRGDNTLCDGCIETADLLGEVRG